MLGDLVLALVEQQRHGGGGLRDHAHASGRRWRSARSLRGRRRRSRAASRRAGAGPRRRAAGRCGWPWSWRARHGAVARRVAAALGVRRDDRRHGAWPAGLCVMLARVREAHVQRVAARRLRTRRRAMPPARRGSRVRREGQASMTLSVCPRAVTLTPLRHAPNDGDGESGVLSQPADGRGARGGSSISSVRAQTRASRRSGLLPLARPSAAKSHIWRSSSGNSPTWATRPFGVERGDRLGAQVLAARGVAPS